MRLKIVLLLSALSVVILRAWSPIESVIKTHWIFNYADGFIKRGLFGELLRRGGVPLSESAINYGAWSMALIAGSLFLFVIVKSSWPARNEQGIFLFAAMALLCPGTLQHIILEAGRFDGVGIIFLTLSVLILPGLSSIQGWLFILPLSLLGVFIHEAFLLMFLPLLLSYWIYLSPRPARWYGALMIFGINGICVYFISKLGVYPAETLPAHLSHLQNTYGGWVDDVGVRILYMGNAEENFHLTMMRSLTWNRFYNHLLLLSLVLAPLWFVFKDVFVGAESVLKTHGEKVLFFSAFGPLLLYPLGHDHFRWWSMVLTNFFLVTAIFMAHNDGAKNKLNQALVRHRILIYVILAISMLVGPIQDTKAFLHLN